MKEADKRRNSLQKELVIMKESRQQEMEFKQWKISSLQREKDVFTMEREKWQVTQLSSLQTIVWEITDMRIELCEGSILFKATPSKNKVLSSQLWILYFSVANFRFFLV